MTEYQAHTGDGEVLARAPQGSSEQEARLWFYREHEPKGAILVLAEFESEAEADAARLSWIEENGINGLSKADAACGHLLIREVIDAARNAPRPTVTVIPTCKPTTNS